MSISNLAFFEKVRHALNEDSDFERSSKWFDGSVLVKIGDYSIWMKWYKGKIIDLHEGPSPLGHTFAIVGPEEAWDRYIQTPHVSWNEITNFGDIWTEGNLFEASRMLEAVLLLTKCMKQIGSSQVEAQA